MIPDLARACRQRLRVMVGDGMSVAEAGEELFRLITESRKPRPEAITRDAVNAEIDRLERKLAGQDQPE